MNILRSVVAVILGYALFAVSAILLFSGTNRDPHASQNFSFVLLAVVYGMIFAGLGGMLSARIAPFKGTLHAAIVALTIALGAAISLVARPRPGSTWSQWAALLLMAPTAWVAAKLFLRRRS